jgi:hypothetical protein
MGSGACGPTLRFAPTEQTSLPPDVEFSILTKGAAALP